MIIILIILRCLYAVARAESNQRHKDFQSSALPTELPSHKYKSVVISKVKLLGRLSKTKRFD